MLSCPDREQLRAQTLLNLRATDWNDDATVEIDRTTFERRQERLEHTALQLLRRAIEDGPGFLLFLEDDLYFNRYLRHNLERWAPFKMASPDQHFFASLYNPNVRALARRRERAFFVAAPDAVYGSQAFLMSLTTARYVVNHWDEEIGMQDVRIPRLIGLHCPVYYHIPSLVQHAGVHSAWGGSYHWAADFDLHWKAPDTEPGRLP
jgi:hypothetical protein